MPKLNQKTVRARAKLKTCFQIWKGNASAKQMALFNDVRVKDIDEWLKTAWHGAVNALENKYH